MLNWFNEGMFKRQYSTHSFSFHLVDKIVFPLKITGKAEWQYGAGDAKSPAGLNMDFNHYIQSSVRIKPRAVLMWRRWRHHCRCVGELPRRCSDLTAPTQPSIPHAFQWKHAKRSISDGSISHRNRQFCQVEAQHWGLVHSRKCQNAI